MKKGRNGNVVDFGATLQEWPKRIWEWDEVRECYLPHLSKWKEQGMPLGAMVWVPAKGYERGAFEYLAARFDGQIMLLFPKKDGEVKEICIPCRDILAVRELRYVLDCRYLIYYEMDGKIECVAMPYNEATQYLFTPFLNCALQLDENFNAASRIRLNPRPEHLLHEAHELYSFSEAAYRLGDKIVHYEWGRNFQITKNFIFKTKKECSWILCEMEEGWCMIECGANYHETTYLYKKYGKVLLEEEKKLWKMEVEENGQPYLVRDLKYETRNVGKEK